MCLWECEMGCGGKCKDQTFLFIFADTLSFPSCPPASLLSKALVQCSMLVYVFVCIGKTWGSNFL